MRTLLDRACSYPVDEIPTHYNAHEDEVSSIVQAQRFGAKRLPGAQNARFAEVNAGLRADRHGHDGDYLLKYERKLCIGTLGGQFDEHGMAQPEFKVSSAATRMAAWLEIDEDPGIQQMLEYSLHADRKSISSPFDMAALIKSWWGSGTTINQVVALYRPMFDALYAQFSGRDPVTKPSTPFQKVIDRWLDQRFSLKFKKVGSELKFDQIVRLYRHENETFFGLRPVWDAMISHGVLTQLEADGIVFACLDAKYDEQCRYVDARQEFSQTVRYVEPDRSDYRIAIVISDNDQILRAARKLDPALDVLIRHGKAGIGGHLGVFDLNKRFDMSFTAMELRIAANHRRQVPFTENLGAVGTISEVPEINYWAEGHGVFNGSPTAPNTKKLQLSHGHIEAAVIKGINLAGRRYKVQSVLEAAEHPKRHRSHQQASVAV